MNARKTIMSVLAGAMLSLSVAQTATAAERKTNPVMGIGSGALERFGGVEGVRNWVESLFYYIMLDNRINHYFKEFSNLERQMFLNTQLESMVLGGDVEYQGASMLAAHADLGLTMEDFNAVVEAAYNACERTNVPYYTCNHLIAALAPFTFEIVTE